jgi:D-glycero-D-manno-heptose 1,7-bisphosphate phosphatase
MRRAAGAAGGAIDRIVYCPHLPDDGCDCRKPLPGLLVRLARHYGVSMKGVPVVGDSARDLAAARALGARPILVLSGNGVKTRDEMDRQGAHVECYRDLLAAARTLASESEREP